MNLILLEEKLQIKFRSIALLEEALHHRSFLNETKGKNLQSNERLEFLGDSVLSLIVSRFLFFKYPQKKEGDLTNLRSSLVKTQTLASIAKELNLGSFLFLSKGEEESGGRENVGLLADAFEAVLGAVFIDAGLAQAEKLISEYLFPLLPEIIKNRSFRDFKSLLQEKIQEKSRKSPFYRVLKTVGPHHQRTFTIGVYSEKNILLAKGGGHSKQEAEQEAARLALENLNQ